MIRFMSGIVVGLLLGLLLAAASVTAFQSRPCVLAIIGSRGAEGMQAMIPAVRVGDLILSRECWKET